MAARKASPATRQAKKASVKKPGKQANGPRASISRSRRDELVEAILAALPPQPPRPMTAGEATFEEFNSTLRLFRLRTRFDNPDNRDDYPVGLEAKLEQIGCQPEDVADYLESEKRVLASMYLEAERPHRSRLKLRQLAMRYALDARKPINDDLTRFKWNRTDDGLILTNMNSPKEATQWNALSNEQSKNDIWESYDPPAFPGVDITDLHSRHILRLVNKAPPPIAEIMDWIERRLGKVPTQDDALPLEELFEFASQNDERKDRKQVPTESASDSDGLILKDFDVKVLVALRKAYPQTRSQCALADETDISTRTVGTILARFREAEYTDRPCGKRSGEVLTQRGLTAAKRCVTNDESANPETVNSNTS